MDIKRFYIRDNLDLSAIFIFTKDRPASLKQTISSLKDENNNIYVIDDSYFKKNQLENYEITRPLINTNYFGKCEFNNHVKCNNLALSKSGFIYEELGNKDWNLGNARNTALLLAKSFGIENALFMDDDIIVNNPNLISNSFKLLESNLFVGAKISGMPDDSIIGHISRELNEEENIERMLSGGFLAFNARKVDMHFPNIYNEDWIWMYLQINGNSFKELGEVFQAKFNPFANYKGKVIFQEFGEIVVDGFIKAEGNFTLFNNNAFWELIINERKKYLETLVNVSQQQNKKSLTEIVNWLKSHLMEFNGFLFSKYFEEYFIQSEGFKQITKKLITVEYN